MKPSIFHHVEPKKLVVLVAKLRDLSRFSSKFLVLLAGSTVIATLGLLLNSPAIVIGAMIIAPLMGPVIGLSLGSLALDGSLLRRAALTLVSGTGVGAMIAYLVALCCHADPYTPEILSRTSPTVLDLLVACFAGAVGAYCLTNEELSDTIAGVAVAVALVPPLGVLGIGLGMNIPIIWIGAAWLYVTNLLGIAVAGVVVFFSMGYRPVHHAADRMILSGLIVLLLMIPLSYSMYELFVENDLSRRIPVVLQSKTDRFKNIRIQDLEVRRFLRPTLVVATVYGTENTVTPELVKQVQDVLIRETGTDVDFRVRVVPSIEIRALDVTANGKTVKPIIFPNPKKDLPFVK